MAKPDEISSTERLLNIIRGKASGNATEEQAAVQVVTTGPQRTLFKKSFGFKKNVVVGVDLGKNQLRLAEINNASEKHPVLTRYASVPYEKDVSFDSPRFALFLKKVLQNFCKSSKNVEVWTTIPSSNVDSRYLQIPKVPKRQLANTVFWSHKREIPIDEKETIFDFEVLGEITESGGNKIEVISYTAPKREADNLKKVFSKAGFPLRGISIIPFAIQNLFRTGWTASHGKITCTLFIGTDWSRIAIFSTGNLILSRDIKAGVQSMVEAMAEELEKISPNLSLSLDNSEELSMAAAQGEESSPYLAKASSLLDRYIRDEPIGGGTKDDFGLEREDIFRTIAPALDRVVRQVERTLDHYYLNYENERVNRVYISGPVSYNERLTGHISGQLGLPVDLIDPFNTVDLGRVDVKIPEHSGERGEYVPAIGIALSATNRTPNFLYTYKDKEKADNIIRLNRSIFAVSIVLLVICALFYGWQSSQLSLKKKSLVGLERELESFVPRVDQNLILQLTARTLNESRGVDDFAKKYMGMAIIGEIVKITPSGIRLVEMAIDLNENKAPDRADRPTSDPLPPKSVVLQGVVTGDRVRFETLLASFMVQLEKSPMFGKPTILSQTFQPAKNGEVLKFSAQVEII